MKHRYGILGFLSTGAGVFFIMMQAGIIPFDKTLFWSIFAGLVILWAPVLLIDYRKEIRKTIEAFRR